MFEMLLVNELLRGARWRDTQLPARLSGLIQRFIERQQPMPLATAQSC